MAVFGSSRVSIIRAAQFPRGYRSPVEFERQNLKKGLIDPERTPICRRVGAGQVRLEMSGMGGEVGAGRPT